LSITDGNYHRDDVKPLVVGFSGSNYKGFATLSDAEEYMRSNDVPAWSKQRTVEPLDNTESLPPVLETDSDDAIHHQ
jgi:viroplasmin and RNaseH domain-containing protein